MRKNSLRKKLMVTQQPEPTLELDTEYDCFSQQYPAYASTTSLDTLRANDYARLDQQQHVYLDYTGGGLYATSQLQQHMELLTNGIYGNPHSTNPSSQAATRLDESAREYVLHYFNASPDEYTVIFTANASGALRLLGEAYPFAEGGVYLLTADNHNSVNGIREFAHSKGADVRYIPVAAPELRLDPTQVLAELDSIEVGKCSLFAFPAQSNFSGVQHDLSMIEQAHARGWDVLLDAAAFAPSNRLDLSVHKPDFISLSFYKMFGYPTGIGALIVRRDTLTKLRRPWFAGGTIKIATVGYQQHYLNDGSAGFEDGTIDYLNLPGIEIGLKHLEEVGIDRIHDRVVSLTGWLLDQMTALKHSNGAPLIEIYGPTTTEKRGGTISFSFLDVNGRRFDYHHVEDRANARNISLRTGCFCNPGAGEIAFGVTAQEIERAFRENNAMTLDELAAAVESELGAVRVSVGIASNFADVQYFLTFARTFTDQHAG
jgi:selenocysteine lyase/cysteine desulfurase